MKLVSPELMIEQVAVQLENHCAKHLLSDVALIGIQRGGAWIAYLLKQRLSKVTHFGSLNAAFYRDDFDSQGVTATITPSRIDFSLDNIHVILVDDVIMSGRTVRAAINELFDYGRPASITLVVLVDILTRDLPIQPDISALQLTQKPNKRIKLICEPELHWAVESVMA